MSDFMSIEGVTSLSPRLYPAPTDMRDAPLERLRGRSPHRRARVAVVSEERKKIA